MTTANGSGITLFLTQTERGTWLAATNESPYLCVEADTEQDAVRIADEAIAFRNTHASVPTPARPAIPITAFRAAKSVRSGEPVAA